MDPMELEEARFRFRRDEDRRRRLEEPPPVSLEAVEDLHLRRPRVELTALLPLYVEILRFVAMEKAEGLTLRSANFHIYFDLERREERDYRPVRVVVPDLASVEAQLVAREWEYTRTKGLLPGMEMLVLQDADGNWLEIRGYREVS